MVLAQNSPELLLLKFLPLTYHHSHFLAATLNFTSFFTLAFLGAAPFFTAWLFLIRYHYRDNIVYRDKMDFVIETYQDIGYSIMAQP